jgi:transketolase
VFDIELIKKVRLSILEMITRARSSHIGSAFSIVEILYILYFHVLKVNPEQPLMESRDRFILSKAHASSALYATLAHRGFFSLDLLDNYMLNNGTIPAHLDMTVVPGLEISAGSLGHGLPIGLGMALAVNKKFHRELLDSSGDLEKRCGQVFVLVSDGELNEGSVWEAIMLAASLKLANLKLVIDYNKIQSFGLTNEIINQANIAERLKAFGWEVLEIHGHDLNQIYKALTYDNSEKPIAIVANTVKGCGVSFMENKLAWHYKSPNDDEFKQAQEEILNLSIESLARRAYA